VPDLKEKITNLSNDLLFFLLCPLKIRIPTMKSLVAVNRPEEAMVVCSLECAFRFV
jgi:hypothetical protein